MAEFVDDLGDDGCGEEAAGEALHGVSDGSYAARVWGKGWRLAKTMAVASVAISSAPVVLPPLLFASTISIAFAIPFGVFFAGYAWTEKIMGSLIPSSGGHVEEGTVLVGLNEESVARYEPGLKEMFLRENKNKVEEMKAGEEIVCALEAGEDRDQGTVIPILRVKREVIPPSESHDLPEESFPPAVSSVIAVSGMDLGILIEPSQSSPEPISPSTEVQSSYRAEVGKTPSPSNLEDLNPEKTIWKEIDAVRMIVGSKGTPEPTFQEEVKALYLFVGIEPPISAEGSYSLGNFEDQLQFLKSIIGVK